jgi:hypothetical protein
VIHSEEEMPEWDLKKKDESNEAGSAVGPDPSKSGEEDIDRTNKEEQGVKCGGIKKSENRDDGDGYGVDLDEIVGHLPVYAEGLRNREEQCRDEKEIETGQIGAQKSR